jgi:hypothetical protein
LTRSHWRPLIPILLTALIGSPTRAALPEFPKDSIAPLYGKWEDGQGRNSLTHSIDPKWITDFRGQCSYRYQYRITKIKLMVIENQKSWDIELESFNPEFLGKKRSVEDCYSNKLPKNSYEYVHVGDVGEPADAPIGVISWESCDTAEHLEQFATGNNKDQRGCGGGLLDRL